MEDNKREASPNGDNVLPETQKVMDDLRAKGHTFDGDEPKKEEAKPEEKPEEEPKAEPEKKEEPEAKKDGEEEKPKRTPREPKEIPLWQMEIERKKFAKELEGKSVKEKELAAKIEDLESKLKNKENSGEEKTDSLDKEIEELTKDYDDETKKLAKNLADIILKKVPKSDIKLPDGLDEKLGTIDRINLEKEREREDLEYRRNFDQEVAGKLREEYPHISEDEIRAVSEKMKSSYFSEKYITLTAGEIYTLSKEEMKGLISNPPRESVEGAARGISRNGKIIDVSNLSEDDYRNLTSEEREKVNKILLNS